MFIEEDFGKGEGETILTQLMSNSHRVGHLGGVSRRMFRIVNDMIGKRIILRELIGLIISWLGLGTLNLCLNH